MLVYFLSLLKAADMVIGYARKWATDLESERLARIVVNHACAAAVAGMAAGVLPGLAFLIASGIAIGAIWRMYYAICKYLQMKLSTNLLKAIGSAILTNIVNQLWGMLAIEFAATFVPLVAIPATGLIFFGVTYLSGLTFLMLLACIFKAGGNPATMSAEEMKREAEKVAKGMNLREEFRNAKKGFKEMRKDGSLETQAEGIDINGDNL